MSARAAPLIGRPRARARARCPSEQAGRTAGNACVLSTSQCVRVFNPSAGDCAAPALTTADGSPPLPRSLCVLLNTLLAFTSHPLTRSSDPLLPSCVCRACLRRLQTDRRRLRQPAQKRRGKQERQIDPRLAAATPRPWLCAFDAPYEFSLATRQSDTPAGGRRAGGARAVQAPFVNCASPQQLAASAHHFQNNNPTV